jgi:hypothetical protein
MPRVAVLLPVLLAFLVGAVPALAWTWPVDGPVLQSFALASDPYAAGQHRGVDIGASEGTIVRAPASGVVSFAGTVPAGGRAITILTGDGFSVTLLHLGSITVAKGSTVEEGGPVGVVGRSGEPEHDAPSVHLGVRVASDPEGYLDPLTLLAPSEPAQSAPEAEPDAPTTPAAPGADGPPEGTTDQSATPLQTVEPLAAAPLEAGVEEPEPVSAEPAVTLEPPGDAPGEFSALTQDSAALAVTETVTPDSTRADDAEADAPSAPAHEGGAHHDAETSSQERASRAGTSAGADRPTGAVTLQPIGSRRRTSGDAFVTHRRGHGQAGRAGAPPAHGGHVVDGPKPAPAADLEAPPPLAIPAPPRGQAGGGDSPWHVLGGAAAAGAVAVGLLLLRRRRFGQLTGVLQDPPSPSPRPEQFAPKREFDQLRIGLPTARPRVSASRRRPDRGSPGALTVRSQARLRRQRASI